MSGQAWAGQASELEEASLRKRLAELTVLKEEAAKAASNGSAHPPSQSAGAEATTTPSSVQPSGPQAGGAQNGVNNATSRRERVRIKSRVRQEALAKQRREYEEATSRPYPS